MSITTHHYNPDWLSDDALVAGFIARQAEFRFLRDELARAPLAGSVQHYLLIGLRGAGKTTLLKRLAVAIRRDDDLADHLIALSFPEELYQVKDLADFWWAACEALVDELDRQGRRADADALMDHTDAARTAVRRGDEPSDAGLALLLDACARLQRRPVMLVDNLDLVFERIDKRGRKLKDPHAAAYWALREALSTTRSPIVIGGSVRLSEPFTDYDKAFYDFFIPKRLGRLELAEVRQVLEHLADRQGSPEIKARLKTRPSRIETLYDLTGGNTRAVGLIFTLLQQGPNSRAVEDFERLMDLTTPYYKARFEDLSEQAQVVMHALAVRRPGDGSGLRFGHTAAELGAHAGLPTNVVSAQLDVLEREGLLEKSAAFGRTQYRIAEQLFRLWLQMRGNRRVRQSALGLTEFLEAMYDEEELTVALQGTTGPALAEARLAFAMADMRGRRADRRSLEAWGADCAARYAAESGAEMNEVLPSCDLSEELATLKALRARLAGCTGHDLTPAEQDALVGALDLRLEAKRAAVDALCASGTAVTEAERMRKYQLAERRKLLRYGLLEADLPLLYGLRARGFFPLPHLHPDDIAPAQRANGGTSLDALAWRLVGARSYVKFTDEAAAEGWLSWGRKHATDASATPWANVAGALRRSDQFTAAREALTEATQRGTTARTEYERACLLDELDRLPAEAEATHHTAAVLDPSDPFPWNGLGILLAYQPERTDETEAAFRKAIEIDLTYAAPWNNLGLILAKQPERADEAEAAYRKAIEIDPTYPLPWRNLGNLLAKQPERADEAEAAYREAIEIDPAYEAPWNNLGNLLAKQPERADEVEAAYRKAIEIDPAYAAPWINLGNLLAEQPERSDEAEATYHKAIELNPAYAAPWYNLGNLLAEQPERADEAEAAYRKAIELNPAYAAPWYNLGLLLAKHPGRLDEAEAAYRKAIEIDPADSDPWNNLGNILSKRPERADEAEAAYRKAIELDPENGRAHGNLGRLLLDRDDLEAAEPELQRAVTLDTKNRHYWQSQLDKLHARRGTIAATRALSVGSFAEARAAMEKLLADAADLPAALASQAFVESFLAPLLANPTQAASVLGLLHGVGYDRHARPLLLAFEAAIDGKAELLDALEPETRNAAKRMYERLTKATKRNPTPTEERQ